MKKIIALLTLTTIISSTYAASNKTNFQKLKSIVLMNNNNGKLDGTPWKTSKDISKELNLIFYVDPDVADINKKLEETLSKQNFSKTKLSTTAIINMDATWKPNIAINIVLKRKQEKYPTTTYVRNYNKTLVKQWSLKDDDYNILLVTSNGDIIFKDHGRLDDKKINTLIKIIKSYM